MMDKPKEICLSIAFNMGNRAHRKFANCISTGCLPYLNIQYPAVRFFETNKCDTCKILAKKNMYCEKLKFFPTRM